MDGPGLRWVLVCDLHIGLILSLNWGIEGRDVRVRLDKAEAACLGTRWSHCELRLLFTAVRLCDVK